MTERGEWLIGLRNLRRSMGLNQSELGEMVGVGQDAISNYERGTRIPRAHHLRALADALGCSIPDLYRVQRLSAPKEPAPNRQALAQVVQARGGSGFWFLTADELKKAAGSAFELRIAVRHLAKTQRIVRKMLAEGGLERSDRKALQRIAKEYTGKIVALSQRVDAVLEAEALELMAEVESALTLDQEEVHA